MRDLFTKDPEYTIDTSSLIEIFNVDTPFSKTHLPGLWDRVEEMILDGRIISHEEVFREIAPGDDLHVWARANAGIFKNYALPEEGRVIAKMSTKYKAFVNAKVKDVHADPWMVAQASCLGISIITEETFAKSLDPAKAHIPNVCADPTFNVGCINLLALIKAKSWTFK